MMIITNRVVVRALPLAVAITSPALAQQDNASANASTKGAAARIMEEIQVTARKRSAAESVQDVPLAITAFGADQLDALYLKDLKDLSFTMPSVQTDEVGTFPGVQNFTIRGQGINSSIPSVDPTVGVFVDGMFLGVSFGVVMDVFDLESVEVLRGPQGLLFGRNVTGGALVMKTARPDGEFGFKGRVRASSGVETNVATMVEGGLSDKVAGKLVLYYNDDDGYWENTTVAADIPIPVSPAARSNPAKGGDAGARTNKFARGTLVWDATENLEFTLITESGEFDGDGAVWTTREAFNSGALDSDETAQDENGITDMTWDQAVVETNWTLGNGVVTNILGYRTLDSDARTDIDAVGLPIFNALAETEQDQISNELRYAFTTEDGKWDVTTGLYYFQQDVEYREQRYVFNPPAGLVVPTNTVNLGGDMDHETWGLFASGDYALTDDITLTAGLRYTREEKDADIVNADPNTGAPPCVDPTFSSCQFDKLSDEWNNLTPKLGVDWQMSEDTKVYALYTKGFRSGGVNFRNALPSIIDPGPTDEEEQDALELGFKSTLADGRMRLNGALYHVRISDMQRELNVGSELFNPVVTSGVIVWQATINAGDVDITGAEMELMALITENFSVTGALGYVDSEYDSISSDVRAAEALLPPGTNLVGSELPRLSPWSASLGLTYDFDLGEAGSLTLRAGYSYRDPAAYNDSNTQILESQRRSNASVQWTSNDAHWSASVFGKNLNDEVQWGSLNAVAGSTSGGATKGRVYGAEVTYTY